MNNYQGDITKYTLDREIIWSSKQDNVTTSSSSRGRGVEVCVFSTYEVCGCNQHTTDLTGCICIETVGETTCQTVTGSGGGSSNNYPNDNGGNNTPGGSGTGTNGDDCTSTGGTVVITDEPLSTDAETGCTSNSTVNIPVSVVENLNTTISRLGLTPAQANWLRFTASVETKSAISIFYYENGFTTQNIAFGKELIDILTQESVVDQSALSFMLHAKTKDKIYNAFDADFLNSVDQFMDLSEMEVAANPHILYIQFMMKVVALRAVHPNWSDWEIYWEASKDFVHIGLDVAGTIPVIGEGADFINGAIYLVEGDSVNAGFSFAAMIPFAGWAATGSKYAVKVVTLAGGEKALKMIAKTADEVAELAIKAAEIVRQATLNKLNAVTNLGVTNRITSEIAETKLFCRNG